MAQFDTKQAAESNKAQPLRGTTQINATMDYNTHTMPP